MAKPQLQEELEEEEEGESFDEYVRRKMIAFDNDLEKVCEDFYGYMWTENMNNRYYGRV